MSRTHLSVRKKKLTPENLTLSKLQLSLLKLLSEAEENTMTLNELERRLYKESKKHKPAAARQSIAGLVRSTSSKLSVISGGIVRKSSIGRGNTATYALIDRKGLVKRAMERNSNASKVGPSFPQTSAA